MFWNKSKNKGDSTLDSTPAEPVLDRGVPVDATSSGDVSATAVADAEVLPGADKRAAEVVVAEVVAAEAVDGVVVQAAPTEEKKGGLLKRAGRKKPADKRKVSAVPIRVLMGYLPEVTERDARDYALGVAEKHFEQPAIAHFDAFKYGEGYAYEVHEGGEGFAYLPGIIAHFNEQGAYRTGEKLEVVLRTGTRMVKVIRQRVGLQAVLLPESSLVEVTEFQPSKEKLQSALNQRTGFLVAGAGFFVAGFFALIVGSMLTRYQPYESAPSPAVTYVNFDDMPVAQWSKVQGLPPSEFVSKLAYEHKHWLQPVIQSADTPHSAAPAVPTGPLASPQATGPASAPSATSGAIPLNAAASHGAPVIMPPVQKPASASNAH
ncbi:hypothetical protein [Burkholderia cenocepacia]|uniref:hypothetical protein n=1 Tax=Burkholderia cenocepacia TaxID=95486 RepID=UPI000760BBD6|nr:hypothetical protein [Burkholderia cenocepacia]KWU17842.1 hypothetical protein AS149_14065 [Burkholderia cenocepacia]